jgi:hypothetical protein
MTQTINKEIVRARPLYDPNVDTFVAKLAVTN